MPRGIEICLCIMGLIVLMYARPRVLAALRYNCNRCKDTGTIWNGSELIRCPSCS